MTVRRVLIALLLPLLCAGPAAPLLAGAEKNSAGHAAAVGQATGGTSTGGTAPTGTSSAAAAQAGKAAAGVIPSAPAAQAGPSAEARPAADPAARWEPQVQAYEKKDKESPPPAGATLLIGSSTIRLWTTAADDLGPGPVIARGVGGCQISDMVYYADRLVVPYKPRRIIFYAGDNDIAAGKSADRIAADWKAFVQKVRQALPDARIYFISIKPSPSRAKFWAEAQKANQAVREFCQATPGLAYIDTATPMLGPDGKPRPELFLKDMLHLNRSGYELWIPVIRAAVEKVEGPDAWRGQ